MEIKLGWKIENLSDATVGPSTSIAALRLLAWALPLSSMMNGWMMMATVAGSYGGGGWCCSDTAAMMMWCPWRSPSSNQKTPFERRKKSPHSIATVSTYRNIFICTWKIHMLFQLKFTFLLRAKWQPLAKMAIFVVSSSVKLQKELRFRPVAASIFSQNFHQIHTPNTDGHTLNLI